MARLALGLYSALQTLDYLRRANRDRELDAVRQENLRIAQEREERAARAAELAAAQVPVNRRSELAQLVAESKLAPGMATDIYSREWGTPEDFSSFAPPVDYREEQTRGTLADALSLARTYEEQGAPAGSYVPERELVRGARKAHRVENPPWGMSRDNLAGARAMAEARGNTKRVARLDAALQGKTQQLRNETAIGNADLNSERANNFRASQFNLIDTTIKDAEKAIQMIEAGPDLAMSFAAQNPDFPFAAAMQASVDPERLRSRVVGRIAGRLRVLASDSRVDEDWLEELYQSLPDDWRGRILQLLGPPGAR